MGTEVGYIDIHLLAATALAEKATLWSSDKRLKEVASKMKLAFDTLSGELISNDFR